MQKKIGRPKGSRNKRTLVRIAQEQRLETGDATLTVALMTEIDQFMYSMRWWMNEFVKAQRRDPPDQTRMEQCLREAKEYAKEAAPYHHARFSVLTVASKSVSEIHVTGGLPDAQDGTWLNPSEPPVIDVKPEEPASVAEIEPSKVATG